MTSGIEASSSTFQSKTLSPMTIRPPRGVRRATSREGEASSSRVRMGGSPVVGRRTGPASRHGTNTAYLWGTRRARRDMSRHPSLPRTDSRAACARPHPHPRGPVTRIHDEADRVRLHPIGCGHPDGRMPPPRWCPADGPDRPAVHPARRDPAAMASGSNETTPTAGRMRRRPPPPRNPVRPPVLRPDSRRHPIERRTAVPRVPGGSYTPETTWNSG